MGRFGVAVATVLAVTALGAWRPALPAAQDQQAQPPQEAKTIWSGVFTDDQAKRGRDLFNRYCQSCHGADMSGGEMAPPLAGSLFLTNWDGQTVGDLEERVRITMPQGDEGSLSRQTVVDILAAIFAANQAPAGQTELPKELPMLKEIKITARAAGGRNR
jgi:cytochrome c553